MNRISKKKYSLHQLHQAWGAGIANKITSPDNKDFNLLGKYFHTYDKTGNLRWQGRILSRNNDVYLVETYSWVMGEKYNEMLVNLSEMLNWTFYDDRDSFLYHGERLCKLPIKRSKGDFNDSQ